METSDIMSFVMVICINAMSISLLNPKRAPFCFQEDFMIQKLMKWEKSLSLERITLRLLISASHER
jgi:hypothetical protein